jgi:CO dehydrogenase maturation factor
MIEPPLIAFVGKGGTGKTTLTALFLKRALSLGCKPTLAIDADPNSCLPDLLGLEASLSVGSLKREVLDKKEELARSSLSKTEYCEYALENAVIESTGFDLLVMGRPDGEGCYCFVNGIVRALIQRMKRSYRLVIADCEAGLEHLSRKTLGDVDTVFIVSDLSRKGVQTAVRQVELMREVAIRTNRTCLIFNNTPVQEADAALPAVQELSDMAAQAGLTLAGMIRHDALITEFERAGRSLLELPEDAVSYIDLTRIVDTTRILGENR